MKRLEIVDRDAERGQNHDIIRGDRAEIELAIAAFGPGQKLHTHGRELLIDVRVVDDFTDEERALARKLGPCFVRVFDGAIHAIAKAELSREPEREVADLQRVARRADRIDDPAVIIRRQRAFNGALEPESFAEIGLLHRVNLTGRHGRRGPHRGRAAPASHRGT